MWNTNGFEPCISGVIRRYKHLFKGENPNPDDEDHREVKMSENQGFADFWIYEKAVGQGVLTKFWPKKVVVK